MNIPILALSQLNRGVENREGGDKRPQLSDLRESGAIEQDADMVLFIHRPEYYKIYQDPETGRDLRGKAEIIVAKHRNGAVGNVLLSFRGEYARFQNPEEDDVSSIMSQSGGDGAESSSVDSISAVNDNSAFPPPPDNNFPPLPDPFQSGPTQSPF